MSPTEPVFSHRDADPLPFLCDGGTMGALIRRFDWTTSPLGPPAAWPQSLKTACDIVLTSKFPMFLAWGPDLRLIYNDGYSEILGDKHPKALGHAFQDVWAEIWEDVGALANRALAGEAVYFENLPLTLSRKGYPEQTWFTFSYSPLRDDSGLISGLLCACTETTQMVLGERRRMDEAERLRQLFDHAPGFMAVLRGPEHVFEMMNPAYLQLVGHRDLIGKTVREALPEVEGQGFFELLDEVYRTKQPFTGHSMQIQLQRSPGALVEERLLDFVFQPIVESDGSVSGIFAEGYDTTERRLAEIAARESEERFRLIADSAPVPMWVTRLDRQRSFVNVAYAEFIGTSYDEALTYDWRHRIHPEDAAGLVADSVAGEATLKPFVLEARYLRHDGEWRWLRSESQPRWGASGEHVGFIGVAHDITEAKEAQRRLLQLNEELEKRVAERTADLSAALDRLQAEVGERHRAEAALRQAQKMEAVGQLTGGIAHDFNNLLTPIMGGLDIIASRVDDERLKRLCDNALDSAKRGAKLTGQLLAFSRIQRISMAPISVNQVIENMQNLLRHTIAKEIVIEFRLEEDVPLGICDANQLENALLNLAINARDAMPAGGTLTISTKCVQLDGQPDAADGDYVCVAVSDTGEGMAEEVLSRATEPFFSTKPTGKGTGLGLAQVYGIARQSGGTLRIASEVGKGTIVELLLPAAGKDPKGSCARPAAPASAAINAAPADALLLVIDDDDDVRTFLSESLEELGYRVMSANCGEEGLRQIEARSPDLVLVDFAMPGMHGAEVASAARKLHPELPIIFVTGYAETEQLEGALGNDVPVLRKPFSIVQLSEAVEQQLPARAKRSSSLESQKTAS
jgi:PAS domain S-box-containing protein